MRPTMVISECFLGFLAHGNCRPSFSKVLQESKSFRRQASSLPGGEPSTDGLALRGGVVADTTRGDDDETSTDDSDNDEGSIRVRRESEMAKREALQQAHRIGVEHFATILWGAPGTSLDDAILDFEQASADFASLELFAVHKMRNAADYRQVYEPMYQDALQLMELGEGEGEEEGVVGGGGMGVGPGASGAGAGADGIGLPARVAIGAPPHTSTHPSTTRVVGGSVCGNVADTVSVELAGTALLSTTGTAVETVETVKTVKTVGTLGSLEMHTPVEPNNTPLGILLRGEAHGDDVAVAGDLRHRRSLASKDNVNGGYKDEGDNSPPRSPTCTKDELNGGRTPPRSTPPPRSPTRFVACRPATCKAGRVSFETVPVEEKWQITDLGAGANGAKKTKS